jgi:hypothetical protein
LMGKESLDRPTIRRRTSTARGSHAGALMPGGREQAFLLGRAVLGVGRATADPLDRRANRAADAADPALAFVGAGCPANVEDAAVAVHSPSSAGGCRWLREMPYAWLVRQAQLNINALSVHGGGYVGLASVAAKLCRFINRKCTRRAPRIGSVGSPAVSRVRGGVGCRLSLDPLSRL